MILRELRNLVAAYLQVDIENFSPIVDQAEGTTVDIFMPAANNAKRYAQNRFDWNFEEAQVYVETVQGKGTWHKAMLASDDTEVTVKQPQTFYYANADNQLVPLYHHSKKHQAVRTKERLYSDNYLLDRRYPDDQEAHYGQAINKPHYANTYEVYVHGQVFQLQPVPEDNPRIYMDAHLYLDDYTSYEDTDELFLEKGVEYMQWATIVEMNHIFQTFIPQQEGNISPPTRMRDNALEALLEWNSFIVESGRQPGS